QQVIPADERPHIRLEKVSLYDLDIRPITILVTQQPGERPVDLYRDNFSAALGKNVRQRSATGAYLDDRVARRRRQRIDDRWENFIVGEKRLAGLLEHRRFSTARGGRAGHGQLLTT